MLSYEDLGIQTVIEVVTETVDGLAISEDLLDIGAVRCLVISISLQVKVC